MSKARASEPAAANTQDTPATATRSFEQTADGIKKGVAAATSSIEETQSKMKENMEKALKTAEELVQFGQGNVEAWVKSGQILSAGLQDLGKQVAANAQATFDETISTFKALTSVKSLREAFDLQAALTRATVEKGVAETSRLTEASFKLAEQAAAPLAARFTLAVETFSKAATTV
jgi:phasin family protein